MVGSIYFIDMPYSDFRQFKARPVLVFKEVDKKDLLILPLTTNLTREGIIVTKNDIEKGSLKKDSIIIVPKITAIDTSLITQNKYIATLKKSTFQKVLIEICTKFKCS